MFWGHYVFLAEIGLERRKVSHGSTALRIKSPPGRPEKKNSGRFHAKEELREEPRRVGLVVEFFLPRGNLGYLYLPVGF